jgi:hypothetical protein
VFLTASNQIVNDLCSATNPSSCVDYRQASKLVSARKIRFHECHASRKISVEFDQNFGLAIG